VALAKAFDYSVEHIYLRDNPKNGVGETILKKRGNGVCACMRLRLFALS